MEIILQQICALQIGGIGNMDRRRFLTASVVSALGIKDISYGLQRSAEAQSDSIQTKANTAAQEVVGRLGDPVEVMLDALFGKQRDQPTPLPTIDHLDPAELCFVVFTDAHMGPKNVKRWLAQKIYNWRTEEVVRQVNALRPQFALHLGDSIWENPVHPDLGSYEAAAQQALAIFGKLQCHFYNIPGTHDFGHHHPPTNDPAIVKQMNEATDRFEKYFGNSYYSFEAKGCTFIVFNNALANVESEEATKQMEWLKQELPKASKAKLAFFATHEPLFIRTPDEEGRGSPNVYLEPGRTELLRLLASNGIDVVYSGHLHFSVANEYKNMYLHTLNSCAQNRLFLSGSGTPVPFPTEAQIDDPYKVGYLVVRVRSGQMHESWVSTYWRVPDPPPEMSSLTGARLVARPATEIEDSVLGITATPPIQFVDARQPSGSMVNDHWWRSGENVGSKWLQVWSPPSSDQEWSDMERSLTLGRPRGVKIAVPLSSESVAMGEEWSRLRPHAEKIDAIVVSNGAPMLDGLPSMYNPQLTTWKTNRNPKQWAAACAEARKLVPITTKIILGRVTLRRINGGIYSPVAADTSDPLGYWNRLPYPSDFGAPGSGLEAFRQAATTLSGSADGIAAWFATCGPPEEYAEEIASAAQIARSSRLELWLDAVGWDYISEPLRSAYFLRLLALCQASGARLFWWNGPANQAGLLDGFYDPTAMYYAAQGWQAFVDPPMGPVQLKTGKVITLQWKDRRGRNYTVWWRPAEQINVEEGWKGIQLSSGSLVADPLHGRLLKIDAAHGLPLCSWPLIARSA